MKEWRIAEGGPNRFALFGLAWEHPLVAGLGHGSF
jgi:hypothetical protein